MQYCFGLCVLFQIENVVRCSVQKPHFTSYKQCPSDQTCKEITHPPNIDAAVLAQAFVVEAVDLGDLPTFVIATDESDAVGIADLEGQKEEEGLDGVVAPIDKVAEEQVILVGAFAADLEQLDEVVELPVDIAAYLRYIFGVMNDAGPTGEGVNNACGMHENVSLGVGESVVI